MHPILQISIAGVYYNQKLSVSATQVMSIDRKCIMDRYASPTHKANDFRKNIEKAIPLSKMIHRALVLDTTL